MSAPPVLDDDCRTFRRTVRDLARTDFLLGYLARAASEESPHREVKCLAAAGMLDLTLASATAPSASDAYSGAHR